MPAPAPPFAFVSAERLAALGIKCLAVGGGFLAGYVLGGLVAWGLDRWVFAQKAPKPVKKLVAFAGGVLVAVLVALMVFGEGSGGGMFGGGGAGDGKKTGEGAQERTGRNDPTPTPSDVRPPPAKVDPVNVPEVPRDAPHVRVTFLGGDAARDGRFYQIDTDPTPRGLDDVRAALEDRIKAKAGRVYLVTVFPQDPRLASDENSKNVKDVLELAQKLGVEVRRPGK